LNAKLREAEHLMFKLYLFKYRMNQLS